MESTPAVPPMLDYPRVLYADGFRFRSWRGGVLCAVAMAFAVAFGATAVRPTVPLVGRVVFGAGAVLGAAAMAALLVAIGADRASRFELTTADIRQGDRLTSWSRVSRVVAGGTPAGATVRLFYTRTLAIDGFTANVELHGSRRLTVAEYEALTDRLRREVLPAHGHLRLGGYESVGKLSGS